MNKNELVKAVAQKAGITKKESLAVLDATFESITEALAAGEKVQLVGFGTFEARQRAARKGRNPQTGEEIEIPATTVPIFKPGKQLKSTILN